MLREWANAHPDFVVGGNEAGMKLGNDIRAADAAVWRRVDVGPSVGRLRHAPPILAVEVAGQDEDEQTLRHKAAWYLAHGVETVWLVLPETREVLALGATGELRYTAGEVLAAETGLPALTPAVDRFFAQLAGAVP